MSETISGQRSIVYRPLAELVPYARNARKHSAKQIKLLRASLARYGWTNAMLIADNVMIAGHGRLAAAIGMAQDGEPIPNNFDPWSGPTVDLSHLSPPDRNAYRLMDNKSALEAGWDPEMLRIEFGDLLTLGVDLSLTGFPKIQIESIMGAGREAGRALGDKLSYQVVVECNSETQQAELMGEFRARGLNCRPIIL